MLAGGDGSRLAVGFRHEFRGTDVGHPDLNRPEALGAQPLAMFADPLSRASHTAMLHVTKANHQPSRAQRPVVADGSLRTDSALFVTLVIVVTLIVVGLEFFPVVALGLLAEGLR